MALEKVRTPGDVERCTVTLFLRRKLANQLEI